ncbi:MAG: hypothetical protein ACRENE_29065 [Polyangiaceae bacterium]
MTDASRDALATEGGTFDATAAQTACAAGQSITCAGPASCAGYQVCRQDGSGYDPCICGVADAAADGAMDVILPDATTDAGGDGTATDGTLRSQGGDAAVQSADSSASDSSVDSGSVSIGDAGGAADSGVDSAVDSSVAIGDAATDSESGAGSDSGSAGSLCFASCPAGTKVCGGACVPPAPQTGCNGPACSCNTPHAIPTCDTSGACAIQSCLPGWADCNGLVSDGCEADLTTTATCTACSIQCTGGQLCSSTGCVATCNPPLTQCGTRCSNLATSPVDCGSCTPCLVPPPVYITCSSGTCNKTCPTGFTLCGGNCLDFQFDLYNCGSCGHGCPQAYTGSTRACIHGSCAESCPPGWTLCGTSCVATQADSANCGTCGNACSTGQYCGTGSCQSKSGVWLVTGLTAPFGILVDGQNVYWSDTTAGTISSVPKAGGSVTTLASGQAKPTYLAQDTDHVYWGNNLGGAVMSVAKSGTGTPQVVSTAVSPGQVAVDDAYLYWLEGGGTTNAKVLRAMKADGGSSTQVLGPGSASGDIVDFAVDQTNYYVSLVQGVIARLDKTTGNLYYPALWQNSNVFMGQLHLEYQEVLFNWNSGIYSSEVGWLSTPDAGSTGGIYSSPSSGKLPTLDLAGNSCGIVFNGSSDLSFFPYPAWANIWATLLTGVAPQHLIADDQYFYWTDQSGAIGRIAVP